MSHFTSYRTSETDTNPSPEKLKTRPDKWGLNTFLPFGIKLSISLHSDFQNLGALLTELNNGQLKSIHLEKKTTLFWEKNTSILTVT